jgi:hopanoid biosynthesis associated protein HpnK
MTRRPPGRLGRERRECLGVARAAPQCHDRSVKRLVVTADDFGLSPEVNAAVRRAYRDGILTCASLMMGAPAVAEAVAIARAERIPVGLHLTLVDGRPVLPPDRVPDLVDSQGRFRPGLGGPAVRLALSERVRRQARAECEAQMDAFLSTGLALDHVNAHHHFHIHPTVLAIVVDLARRCRPGAVRVPYEPGLPPYRQALLGAAMMPWTLRARRRLRRAGVVTNDALFGLYDTGMLTEAAWLRIVPRIKPGLFEVYCHPATRTTTASADEGSSPADELAALLSPVVREALDRAGIERTAFAAAGSAK